MDTATPPATHPTGHPHGAMRRKDREITNRLEIDEIIHANKIMHLALADNNVPFLVPLYYAYDGTSIFFHSANRGTKIAVLKNNNAVCFSISQEFGVIPAEIACDFEAKHQTVIGFGKAAFIEDEAEKIQALDRIVARFTDRKFEYPKANLNCAVVVRIVIESIKGKKHGF